MHKMKKGEAKKDMSESTFPTPFKSDDVSERWKGLLTIIDEAHLPKLGMPLDWRKTKEKHTRIVVNPITNETINIETGVIIKHQEFPVGFIKSTLGSYPIPETDQPAAVRYARYIEPGYLSEHIVIDPYDHPQVPCIAHGDYVSVTSLAADHIQARKVIRRRQKALIEKLNDESEPEFAEFLMKQDGMDKFFVQWKGKYYGTLFFYEIYLNDIDNIWLICDACNRYKKDQDTVQWFEKQWLYGPEFLDHLGKINDEGILLKAKDKKGLAQIAIEWFWNRHAHYISVAKALFKDITRPIQILNQQVDHVIGSGNQKRAERLQVTLNAKLEFLSSIAQAKKLGMPRRSDESPHSSSNDNDRLSPLTDADGKPIDVTCEEYSTATSAVASKFETWSHDELKQELQTIIEKRPQDFIDNDHSVKKPRFSGGLT